MAGKLVHLTDARGPRGVVVYAIGDVHGRLDLLSLMHEAIADDLAQRKAADWRIIHLGDYVDRGPESRGVLDFLVEAQGRDGRILSLVGNHDIGFLDFLAEGDPTSIFARYGGAQTAKSYGVELNFSDLDRFDASHLDLVAAVPQAHVDFMKSLKFSLVFGDFFFCHAGIRPTVPLDQQDTQDLIWIRDEFHRHAELYPKIIVHGHTPSPDPEVLANRINIDTGAFSTGRLTALVIDGAEKTIFSVEDLS